MIKIFKKRIDSFRGLPLGFVGKLVRMLAASLLLEIFWKQKGEKGNAEGA